MSTPGCNAPHKEIAETRVAHYRAQGIPDWAMPYYEYQRAYALYRWYEQNRPTPCAACKGGVCNCTLSRPPVMS